MQAKALWLLSLLSAVVAGCDATPRSSAQPALTMEGRKHAETMASEAQQVIDLLETRKNAGLLTPELAQLRLDWSERLYECQILLQPGAKVSLLDARALRDDAIGSDLLRRNDVTLAAMARYATAEVAALRILNQKSSKDQRIARDEMASAAAHVYAGITEMDAIQPQTIPWRTLKGKWLWRAANAAISSTPAEVGQESTVREWVRIAGLQGGAGGESRFVEDFGAARLRSLQGAMRREDNAVHGAAIAMVSAARAGVEAMQRSAGVAAPEFTQALVDWSRKWMESEILLYSDKPMRLKAAEDHAARMRHAETAVGATAGADEVSMHILKFAMADAEYQAALLK